MITLLNRLPISNEPRLTDKVESNAMMEKLQAELKSAREATGSAIANHPVIAIGGAITLGVLVGWLIKRR